MESYKRVLQEDSSTGLKSRIKQQDQTKESDSKEEINTYVKHLIERIEYFSDIYKSKQFDTIYIGGGTPSVIGTDNLVNMVKNFRNDIIKRGSEVRFSSKLTDIIVNTWRNGVYKFGNEYFYGDEYDYLTSERNAYDTRNDYKRHRRILLRQNS